jgi:hypothetical protein
MNYPGSLVIRRAMQIEPYIRRLPRLRLDRIVKLRLGSGEPGKRSGE